ncbi:DUF1016 N-terminal domain-containing protein [Prevotella lacticifex]|nr:DUF1016 N-terminal domain-containing protein [Prevotella lacticifex]
MVSCCPIWSHYRILLQVSDDDASEWYAKEAVGQTWSVRTLLNCNFAS